MEEARAIVFVPNTSLVEAAAVFEQKRATLASMRSSVARLATHCAAWAISSQSSGGME